MVAADTIDSWMRTVISKTALTTIIPAHLTPKEERLHMCACLISNSIYAATWELFLMAALSASIARWQETPPPPYIIESSARRQECRWQTKPGLLLNHIGNHGTQSEESVTNFCAEAFYITKRITRRRGLHSRSMSAAIWDSRCHRDVPKESKPMGERRVHCSPRRARHSRPFIRPFASSRRLVLPLMLSGSRVSYALVHCTDCTDDRT